MTEEKRKIKDAETAIVVHEKVFEVLKGMYPDLKEVEFCGAMYLVEDTDKGRKYRFLKSELLEV